MPITLNHSNIGVQYNTGSNYIIETVKSDLYLRNEIYNTIVSNNIQTAPVTPVVYIENTSNIYAVESYTYTGTANTADYTRVFPKNTVCDILIVGGGGGGGKRHGGGGGAGTLLYHKNITLNGTYNIKVGKGGAGQPSNETPISSLVGAPEDGGFSQFIKSDGAQNYYAIGGGRGTGGKGTPNPPPYVYANTNGGQGFIYDANITLSPNNIFNGVAVAVSNKQYVNTLTSPEGCRGNVGGIQITNAKGGGGGGAGGAGMNHDAETTVNDGYGGLGLAIDITGTSVVYAGGGSGADFTGSVSQVFDPAYPTIESRGGGGYGSDNGTPQNGLNGTGGGGGAQGNDTNGNPSGSGGSGIVIIRYLLGTVPTNNFLTSEPIVISPVMSETIRTFTHSGGTETQTSYTITVGQNTICDILMIGGGGGGGKDRAGGGGAGALILSIGNILSAGTYTIRVGKGSLGATTGVNAVNGYDCEIVNSVGTVIYRAKGGGGGQSINDPNNVGNAQDGGCGGGKVSQFTGLGGNAVSTNIVGGITTGPVVTTAYGVYGKDGGRNITGWNGSNGSALDGAGGGGIGEGGSDTGSLVAVDSQFVANSPGKGGDGLYFATINGIVYNFKNYFNVNGIQDGTTGNFFIGGGGGGGGDPGGTSSKGGGGSGGTGSVVGVSATGYGSGGGGGGGGDANGGNGSAGIVIIKFKSTTAISEGNPITHKRLNYVYEPRYPSISVDNTNLKAWYKFDGNYNDSSGSGFNLTNSEAVIVDGLIEQSLSTDSSDFLQTSAINLAGKTYSISFRAKLNTTPSANAIFFQQGTTGGIGVWLAFFYHQATNTLRFSHYGSGNDIDTTGYNISSMIGTSWHHYVATYNNTNRAGEIWFDGVKLNTNISTFANVFSGSGNFTIARSVVNIESTLNGLMEDFRYYDKVLTSTEISQLYNIPTLNTYTLNFPVPTIADINNNSNIVLRGAYDISLSTMNSSIIPKSNQYIPKPTTFASDLLSIRYNLLNPVLDPSGAQLTYNTSNTNVYHMGSVGIGTKSPEYHLDVRGSVNAKSYYLNGRQINEPISELGLSEGMIAQVRHLTYTQMEIKNNTGWDAINDNLTTGFVIAITPKSNLSKILVNIIVQIGLSASNYSVWWGIKLYRKIGSGDWTEVTGPNGTETGSAAATAGTPVWISYTMYAGDLDYQYKVTNVTGTYLDSPNTTSTVYYTAYWNNRLGDNPSAINTIYLNRAESHGDAWRPAPSSSWTASEIWYG
jgi:hypothetical protein